MIENYEFLSAVASGVEHEPGFAQALEYVRFKSAWLQSCQSGAWVDVVPVGESG